MPVPPVAVPAGAETPQRDLGRPRPWSPSRPPVVSPGSAERFAERQRLRRHLARRHALWVVGSVLAASLLAWALLISPLLALHMDEVVVRGEGTVVDPAAVTAVVEPHAGTPLTRLDTVALRRTILDVPGVRAAQVSRLWPHGLRVVVVSREPVAAVPADAGGVALVDAEGIQVGRADAAPEGLPVVRVPLDDPDARALTAVLTVLQQLPPELSAEIATVEAGSRDTVSFTLHDGARVEWGSADQNALKARVLQTLRSAPASATASVYDVSAPTLPITTS